MWASRELMAVAVAAEEEEHDASVRVVHHVAADRGQHGRGQVVLADRDDLRRFRLDRARHVVDVRRQLVMVMMVMILLLLMMMVLVVLVVVVVVMWIAFRIAERVCRAVVVSVVRSNHVELPNARHALERLPERGELVQLDANATALLHILALLRPERAGSVGQGGGVRCRHRHRHRVVVLQLGDGQLALERTTPRRTAEIRLQRDRIDWRDDTVMLLVLL
uniref:Uncharacterized protein n=1 Tax=Anopheles coluzzii TaxID=1518534 RepID=A0A8W7PV83_ANOCL